MILIDRDARIGDQIEFLMTELAERPPADPAGAEAWAVAWAERRLAVRRARDFKESDRIRDLLAAAGWEVRDRKDGAVEVVRR